MLSDTLKLAVMLLILFDALGSAPIFSMLLAKSDDRESSRIVTHACATSFWLLFAFAIGGRYLLGLFGMTLAVFQIAGGLLLLLTSIDLVFGILPARRIDPESMPVFPMAYPLIAGPGALAAVMSVTGSYESVWKICVVSFAALVIAIVPTWLILLRCRSISKMLGKQGSAMIGKLMGVLLTGISVSFILKGIVSYFGIVN